MSFFVAIEAVFLPMGFFCQYFALDATKNLIRNQAQLWARMAPTTIIFGLVVIGIILKSRFYLGSKYQDRVKIFSVPPSLPMFTSKGDYYRFKTPTWMEAKEEKRRRKDKQNGVV